MKRELKIIIEYETEGMDCDQPSLNTTTVKVYHDDKQIGFIQKLRFLAEAKADGVELEISFPDTSNWSSLAADLINKIAADARDLSKISGVIVKRS